MHTVFTNHYDTLEVGRDASVAELKTAYLRLIREYTPENDPERFRLVSEAYRTLSNPEKRKKYDREGDLPAEVEAELAAILEQAEDDVHSATRAMRALRARHDASIGGRRIGFLLGVLLDRQDRHPEAITVFQELADRDNTDFEAQVWLGDSLQKNGDHVGGRRVLKEIIVRDKDCTEAYLCLSRSYFSEQLLEESIKTLDRGIHADGRVDIQDLPLFVEKIAILAVTTDWARLEVAGRDLQNAISNEDTEARQYASSQLAPLISLFIDKERFDLCHYLLTVALALDPTNDAIRKFSQAIEEPAQVQRRQGVQPAGSSGCLVLVALGGLFYWLVGFVG